MFPKKGAKAMQSHQIPDTEPAGGVNPGATLTKAVMRAAGFLGISQAIVASVLGISTASVSTMPLVDSLEEQAVLEAVLDAGKPAVPPDARHLHYLIFTPFRYPPSPWGSRFRGGQDPGVFYGADAIRTACAELGYWRWRFLLDSPALPRIDARPQTLFQVSVRTDGGALD